MKSPNSGAKTIMGAVFGLIFAILGVNLGNKLISGSSESALKKEVEKFNKELPQQLDEITRIDSISLPSDKILIYYLTVDVPKDEISPDYMKESVAPNILNIIRTEPNLDIFRKRETTWYYKYYDNRGSMFFEYVITPEMYK